MIKNLLHTCGLNATEQELLLYLIQFGGSHASTLAKRTGIKRTTVYATLDSLAKLGLVSKRKQEGSNFYSSASVQAIPKILKTHAQREFEEVGHATKYLSKELENLNTVQSEFMGFDVQRFESVAAVYTELENSLLGGDFSAFFNPQTVLKNPNFKELVKQFLKHTAKSKVNIREIGVDGPETKWYCSQIKNPNHHFKTLPCNRNLSSDMIMVNGEVILIHYDAKNEGAIRIREKNFYQSMLALFEELWGHL